MTYYCYKRIDKKLQNITEKSCASMGKCQGTIYVRYNVHAQPQQPHSDPKVDIKYGFIWPIWGLAS